MLNNSDLAEAITYIDTLIYARRSRLTSLLQGFAPLHVKDFKPRSPERLLVSRERQAILALVKAQRLLCESRAANHEFAVRFPFGPQ